MGLAAIDWIIMAIFLIIVISLGLLTKISGNYTSLSVSYFLAGKTIPWWITAASIFASNIGSEHFVGQAGLAASGGISTCLYEWTAAYLLLFLGYIFAPIYLKNKLTTIPQYLEDRFNRHCRVLSVTITLICYIVSKLGATLYAGTLMVKAITDINIYLAATFILLATTIYTISGGLRAVLFTDTLQSVIFVIGGIFGAIYALNLINGFSNLFSIFNQQELQWLTHMIHPNNDRDFPWLGMLVGLPIYSIWYWCIDQEMAQRVLCSKGLDDANLGCVTAGFAKLTPLFITVAPGMVARALYEQCKWSDGHLFSNWCTPDAGDMSNADDANYAYINLILREFPIGIKGILFSAFVAAMMSSLSSVFNSAATLFTYDIYLQYAQKGREINEKHLVYVGRIVTFILTILTLLMLPIIESNSTGMYLVSQYAFSHLAPTISALFILALFWKRSNGEGALAALIVGSIIGIIRFVTLIILQDYCGYYTYEENGRIIQILTWRNFIICMNFGIFATALFLLTLFIMVIVSLCYPAPSEDQIKNKVVDWKFIYETVSIFKTNNKIDDHSLNSIEGTSSEIPLILVEEKIQCISYKRLIGNILGILLLISVTVLIVVFH